MGVACSFRNSFMASANGCGRPISPTLFGPLRIWIYPSTFRSSKVKKAIASRIIKKVRIVEDKKEIGMY